MLKSKKKAIKKCKKMQFQEFISQCTLHRAGFFSEEVHFENAKQKNQRLKRKIKHSSPHFAWPEIISDAMHRCLVCCRYRELNSKGLQTQTFQWYIHTKAGGPSECKDKRSGYTKTFFFWLFLRVNGAALSAKTAA